ncbi:MAG TPA: vanadium-dependent haloperoxidase [Chryseolinea sp.]|nr:vanadium-dependent haloperoxidase [Chryseolinea sp.]
MSNVTLIKNCCYALVIALLLLPTGCDEDEKPENQTQSYSSDVVSAWLDVQVSMLFAQTGNPFGFNPSRYMAYCGVALYESVVPGMPAYQSLYGQLTDMPEMPAVEPGQHYHWPASANAALAAMTQNFFSTTTAYNGQAVADLETQLNDQYRAEVGDVIFERSVEFGKAVATKIFEWSKTDNAAWPTSVTPPTGDGVWKSETGAAPVNPYWGYNRLMVPGSLNNSVSPPLAYSTDPSSPYYKEMKEVYDVSQNLTHEQKLIAKYFNDSNPGYPAGGHYICVLKQVIEQFNPALDKAAVTYAKTGITLFDATTSSFKAKYEHWKERPFSFIRSIIAPTANPVWKPFIPTPGFPDFPSNHAVFSSSVAHVLSSIYGSQVSFTDETYEGMTADLGNGVENLGSRHYDSFEEMTQEISMSRLYGGIHYRYSCEEGMKQGKKVAENIDNTVKFLK